MAAAGCPPKINQFRSSSTSKVRVMKRGGDRKRELLIPLSLSVVLLAAILHYVGGAYFTNSRPFGSISFRKQPDGNLRVSLTPSSERELPECLNFQLSVYKNGNEEDTQTEAECSRIDCMSGNKVYDVRVNGRPSGSDHNNLVMFNCSWMVIRDNGQLEQCSSYLASIQWSAYNQQGFLTDRHQVIPFIYDDRQHTIGGDWEVNNFTVSKSGPDWMLLTWLRPSIYAKCVQRYELTVFTRDGAIFNRTTVGADVVHLNVSSGEDEKGNEMQLRPCSIYSLRLVMFSPVGSVNAQINGSTSSAVPGQVTNLRAADVTKDSIRFTWSKPTENLECAGSYSVDFHVSTGTGKNNDEPVEKKSPFSLNVNQSSYMFTDLKPCVRYTVNIKTIGRQFESQQASVSATTSSEVPDTVEVFEKRDLNATGVSLAWTSVKKFPACVRAFLLSYRPIPNRSTQLEEEHHQLLDGDVRSYRLSSLEPCTRYLFSLYSVGDEQSKSQSYDLNITTREHVPERVRNAAVSRRGGSLLVEWQEPAVARNCVSKYRVRYRVLNDTQPPLTSTQVDLESDEREVTLSNLTACVQYEVAITVVTPLQLQSEPVILNETTSPQVLAKPIDGKVTAKSQHWAILRWFVPHPSNNRCQMYPPSLSCSPTSNGHLLHDGPDLIEINATDLVSYTMYTCQLLLSNIAGPSEPSEQLKFMPLEPLPEAPAELKVKTKTSNSITISWKKPANIPQTREPEDYNVTVICSAPVYEVPEDCPTNLSSVGYSVKLSGPCRTTPLDRLHPYWCCSISVAASSFAGYGPPNKIDAITLPDMSEPVRDIRVKVKYNVTVLSWLPPCFPNGIILGYLVNMTGNRKGYDPDNRLPFNVTGETRFNSGENSRRMETQLVGLEPAYSYDVLIGVIIDSVSGIAMANARFNSSAHIPEETTVEKMKEIAPTTNSTELPAHQARITLTDDLFSDKNGDILYYAVLIAEDGHLGDPQSGLLFNDEGEPVWPRIKTWAHAATTNPKHTSLYQTTPPWWTPTFHQVEREGKIVRRAEFVIGAESCSMKDVEKYCNGRLKPGTKYNVRIRGFTSTGFMDSPLVAFTTAKHDESTSSGGSWWKIFLSLLIAAVVSVTVFILYTALRSRSRDKRISKANNMDIDYLKPLSMEQFLLHADQLLMDGEKLTSEFVRLGSLSTQIKSSYFAAQLPINKKKNRYNNVIPYDSTRVVLQDVSLDSDYINASYIKDEVDMSRVYIACQAPLEYTCIDFWRMIDECRVQSIVMLCNFQEKGKTKCHTYFPDEENESMTFDNKVVVTCQRMESYQSYRERYLSIVFKGEKNCDKEEMCRMVKHFHFCDWPDFGVPSQPETLLTFWKVVNDGSCGHPVAVHCSAGIGRTGTYIAIDLLLHHAQSRGSLNVVDMVLRLREQRANMVQAEVQYGFIYKTLKHAFENQSQYLRGIRSRMSKSKKKKSLVRNGKVNSFHPI